jgi:hypothetical protein
MAAGRYDIYIEQGATFKLTITVKDSNGDPVDLTGLTFRGKIKKSFQDVSSVADFTFNVLDQTVQDTLGKLEFSLSAVETAAIAAPAKGTERTLTYLVYDIESEVALGFVKRLLEGKAIISPEVTI